jgi:hypothetical protein
MCFRVVSSARVIWPGTAPQRAAPGETGGIAAAGPAISSPNLPGASAAATLHASLAGG